MLTSMIHFDVYTFEYQIISELTFYKPNELHM